MICWLCFLVVGCTLASSIRRDFQQINSKDGVDRREAVIIAQHTLVESYLKSKYNVSSYFFYTVKCEDIVTCANHWFVEFDPKIGTLVFNESDATYHSRYLVVINKHTGRVVFRGKYLPGQTWNFDWVFKYGE